MIGPDGRVVIIGEDQMDEGACTDELMYRSIVRDLCAMAGQSV
jgi:hypothetical protein